MEKLSIMRSVVIKQVVTEKFKKKAAAEIQEALKKVEGDIDAFDKQTKKTVTELTLKGHPQVNQIKQQFETEREKLNSYKKQLIERLKVISNLKLGEEVVQGNIDSPVEVKIGDNFDNLFRTEIVVKDGEIIDIRNKEQE